MSGIHAALSTSPELPRSGATARFASFRLDLESGELRRDGRLVPLRPQATRVLAELVEAHPNMVDHRRLRHLVWGDSAIEWEPGLHQIIRQIRRVLDDDAGAPAFIENVPRRGYRFIADVERGSNDEPDADFSPPQGWRSHSGWRDATFWLTGVLTLPVLVVLVCWALAAGGP